MKSTLHIPLLCALLGGATTLSANADLIFSDQFGTGSTVNSPTQAAPTQNSTAYSILSAKSWSPTPLLSADLLRYGIASSSSGTIEVQALFTSSPVSLVTAGDFVQVVITFTNNTGLFTANMQMGVGLYNSGQVMPIAGGL